MTSQSRLSASVGAEGNMVKSSAWSDMVKEDRDKLLSERQARGDAVGVPGEGQSSGTANEPADCAPGAAKVESGGRGVAWSASGKKETAAVATARRAGEGKDVPTVVGMCAEEQRKTEQKRKKKRSGKETCAPETEAATNCASTSAPAVFLAKRSAEGALSAALAPAKATQDINFDLSVLLFKHCIAYVSGESDRLGVGAGEANWSPGTPLGLADAHPSPSPHAVAMATHVAYKLETVALSGDLTADKEEALARSLRYLEFGQQLLERTFQLDERNPGDAMLFDRLGLMMRATMRVHRVHLSQVMQEERARGPRDPAALDKIEAYLKKTVGLARRADGMFRAAAACNKRQGVPYPQVNLMQLWMEVCQDIHLFGSGGARASDPIAALELLQADDPVRRAVLKALEEWPFLLLQARAVAANLPVRASAALDPALLGLRERISELTMFLHARAFRRESADLCDERAVAYARVIAATVDCERARWTHSAEVVCHCIAVLSRSLGTMGAADQDGDYFMTLSCLVDLYAYLTGIPAHAVQEGMARWAVPSRPADKTGPYHDRGATEIESDLERWVRSAEGGVFHGLKAHLALVQFAVGSVMRECRAAAAGGDESDRGRLDAAREKLRAAELRLNAFGKSYRRRPAPHCFLAQRGALWMCSGYPMDDFVDSAQLPFTDEVRFRYDESDWLRGYDEVLREKGDKWLLRLHGDVVEEPLADGCGEPRLQVACDELGGYRAQCFGGVQSAFAVGRRVEFYLALHDSGLLAFTAPPSWWERQWASK